MKKEKFCELLSDINEKYVLEARTDRRAAKRSIWIRWSAVAACLCLIMVGASLWKNGGSLGNWSEKNGDQREDPVAGGAGVYTGELYENGGRSEGGDPAPGGEGLWPEGVDPVVASVAVLPAGAELVNVADATVVSVSETEARTLEGLGAYIPDTLPEGCRYGKAGYYETTMKDGTRYHMLRVTYECGAISVPVSFPENEGENEAEQGASEMLGHTAFVWMVWGHRPDTNLPIYQPDEVTAALIAQQEGSTFYIDCGDIYVGISSMEISAEDMLAVIQSVIQ